MGRTMEKNRDAAKEGNKRLNKARRNLREMEKTIAPFTKRRKFEQHSTAGRWRDATDYERSDVFHDLKKMSDQ